MDDKYKTLAAYLESAIPIVSKMGLTVVSMKERYVKLLMPISNNINHVGTMYAGSLFTLGEIMGGAIFVASMDMSKYYPLVKDVQIRYRRPAMTDITTEISLSVDRLTSIISALEARGKSDVPLELELLDSGGEVVAVMTGTWQVRKK
jgi:thioesterase domain-containing protein